MFVAAVFCVHLLVFSAVSIKQSSFAASWTVDDDGPADFSLIQDAIDASSDGDSIVVANGVYVEQLVIDKSLSIVGENKSLTIVDGDFLDGDTVVVLADGVCLSNLTVRNCGEQKGNCGVWIGADNCCIEECVIRNNGAFRFCFEQGGIVVFSCSNVSILRNIFTQNMEAAIYLHHSNYCRIEDNNMFENSYLGIVSNASSYNRISGNDVFDNVCGMTFWPYSSHNQVVNNYVHDQPGCGLAFKAYSDWNVIRNNTLENTLEWGIMLGFGPTKCNVVEYNTISGVGGGSQNWFDGSGLVLSISFCNCIRFNNFFDNDIDIYLENSVLNLFLHNYFDNYSGFGPKIIWGHFSEPYVYHPESLFPWFAVDWVPAEGENAYLVNF